MTKETYSENAGGVERGVMNKSSGSDPTVTVKEAAERLGVSEQWIRLTIQRGLVPFGRCFCLDGKGRRLTYYIWRKEFEAYLKDKVET